ncbi:MAG: DUF6261 family protein [Puniceicoccales bacterium]|nr:DUF6261 family protein [Puniceicoccales bacterium]
MIRKIQLSRLRNEEHFGFHSEFVKLANERDLSEGFTALRAIYNECYDKLDETMETVRKSDFTRQLEEADREQIYTYRRLRSAVRGYLRTSDQEKRLAANRTITVIRHYGNLALTSRDKRAYGLTNLMEDLRGETAADLQKLGVMNWVGELEADVAEYKKLQQSREDEKKTRYPGKSVDAAREEADAAYQSLIHQLEAQGALNPTEENFANLVFHLNTKIDRYNRLIAQRYGIMAAQKEREAETVASSSSAVPVAA